MHEHWVLADLQMHGVRLGPPLTAWCGPAHGTSVARVYVDDLLNRYSQLYLRNQLESESATGEMDREEGHTFW